MRTICSFLLVLLAAPVFAFDQGALDKHLDTMAQAKRGDAASWKAARVKVVEMGSDVVPALETVAAEANWTTDGWHRALAAEVCRLRIARPELATEVEKPRGIDPAEYRKFRHGKPSCHRDFAHRGKEIVPVLLEALEYLSGDYTFSAGEAGVAERQTLFVALIQAPGEALDARAQFAMQGVLLNAEYADDLRAFAAVSFGQCAGSNALATLAEVIDGQHPIAVREGAALALGWAPDKAALDAIKTRLSGEQSDAKITRALECALGNLGGAWAWQSRGAEKSELAKEIRKGCADLLVAELKARPENQDIICTALCMVAWKESLAAVKAIAADANLTQAQKEAANKTLPLLEMAVSREK
jgi:hypothetical protein